MSMVILTFLTLYLICFTNKNITTLPLIFFIYQSLLAKKCASCAPALRADIVSYTIGLVLNPLYQSHTPWTLPQRFRSWNSSSPVDGHIFIFYSLLFQAEGLTAIEAWVIVCVLFVFGALIEYAGLLLKMKLEATRCVYHKRTNFWLHMIESNVAFSNWTCKKRICFVVMISCCYYMILGGLSRTTDMGGATRPGTTIHWHRPLGESLTHH